MTSRQSDSRGYVLIVVLITLAVVSLVLAGLFKSVLLQRAMAAAQRREIQTECLVSAAIERGKARHLASPEYEGETWIISADELGLDPPATGGATITIKVVHNSKEESGAWLSVIAEYPDKELRKVRLESATYVPAISEPRS